MITLKLMSYYLFLGVMSTKIYFTQDAYYVKSSLLQSSLPLRIRLYLTVHEPKFNGIIKCHIEVNGSASNITKRIMKQLDHWTSKGLHYISLNALPPLEKGGKWDC